MSDFMNSMTTADALTANGALTNSTSSNFCLDWFFTCGALRGKNDEALQMFKRAIGENTELAVRVLLWSRDVRGGAGERGTFRHIVQDLANNPRYQDVAKRIMVKVPELGRWDDLKEYFGTPLQKDAVNMILHALVNDKNALCAKWMPRKGPVFNALFRTAEVTPKQMRKILVLLSDTVEQKMCAQKWDEIDFGKLPSVASARYQKSFGKNAPERYTAYIEGLEKGTEKINAGAVYPYDVVKSVSSGNERVADQQWKALPNYMEGSTERVMPIVDVSGSMSAGINGEYSRGVTTCMDVAISLGIYIAERNESIFKNEFISFSSDPHFHTLSGSTLSERIRNMKRSGENMSTDINKCFRVLLHRAVQCGLSNESLPTKMLIMSDMKFDLAGKSYWGDSNNQTNLQAIREDYERAGYKMPQLVFWNLNGRQGNSPVKVGDEGTALVSGCSPAILTSVLGGKLNPFDIMLEAVGKERYAF